jgi:hypothetical protein
MKQTGTAQYIVRITNGKHVWYWQERDGGGRGRGVCDRKQASRVSHARALGLIEYLRAPGGFDRTDATTVTMVRAGSRDPYYWEQA